MKRINDSSEGIIERLVKRFNLEAPGNFTQDWEYIVASSKQLNNYISCYQSEDLCKLEKELLMRIILQAYDDYVSFDLQEGIEDIYKEQIKKFLTRDYLIHKETIEYWSLEDYDLKDSFVITPFIREIKLRMDINGE